MSQQVQKTSLRWTPADTQRAKIAGVVILGAIAAILILGGMMNLLTQKSLIDWSSINTLNQAISSKLDFILGGGVAALDAILIAKMVRTYLKKHFTQKELTQKDFPQKIKKELIAEQMPERSYWALPPEDNCYALVVKSASGKLTMFGFKKDKYRGEYIQSLVGYADAQAEDLRYRSEYVEAKLGSNRFQRIKNQSDSQLNAGFYRIRTFKISDTEAYIATIHDHHFLHHRFYKQDPTEIIKQQFSSCINKDKADAAILEGAKQIPVPLFEHEFWPLDVTCEGFTLYGIKTIGVPTYFRSKEKRDEYITKKGLKPDVKADFEARETYTREEIEALIPEKAREFYETIVPDDQFKVIDLQHDQFFGLVVNGKGWMEAYQVFKTKDARNKYIDEELRGFIDHDVCFQALEKEFQAQIKKYQLESLLNEEGMYWCFNTVYDDKTFYLAIFQEDMKRGIWGTEAERTKDLKKFTNVKLTELQKNGYITGYTSQILNEEHVHTIEEEEKALLSSVHRDFSTFEFPDEREQGTVYTLIYNAKAVRKESVTTLHFSSAEKRDAYIKEHLNHYRPIGKIKQELQNIIKEQKLADLRPDDPYACHVEVDGTTYYYWITKDKQKGFQFKLHPLLS